MTINPNTNSNTSTEHHALYPQPMLKRYQDQLLNNIKEDLRQAGIESSETALTLTQDPQSKRCRATLHMPGYFAREFFAPLNDNSAILPPNMQSFRCEQDWTASPDAVYSADSLSHLLNSFNRCLRNARISTRKIEAWETQKPTQSFAEAVPAKAPHQSYAELEANRDLCPVETRKTYAADIRNKLCETLDLSQKQRGALDVKIFQNRDTRRFTLQIETPLSSVQELLASLDQTSRGLFAKPVREEQVFDAKNNRACYSANKISDLVKAVNARLPIGKKVDTLFLEGSEQTVTMKI